MLSTHTWTWLMRIAVALALPTVMCFGYYSLDAAQEKSAAWSIGVSVSYPLALLGLLGMVASVLSPRPSRRWRWLATLCFVIPTAFLMVVRS